MQYRYEIKFKNGEVVVARSEYDYKTYIKRIMGREYIICGDNKLRRTSEIVGINEKRGL